MYLHATIYAIPLLIGASIALIFCFLALQRFHESGAPAFIVGMASVALWSFAYAFEIMAPTVADKLPWHRIIYSMSATVPAYWLLFLIQHEYGLNLRTKLSAIVLSIEPVLYILITWTNGSLHNWLWRSIELNTERGLPYMVLDRSPGFYWHVGFTYFLVLISVVLFLRMLRRDSSTLSALQISLLILGIVSPVVANTVHLVAESPWPINLTPFSLITMGATVGWFAFRFDLWDILPAAHDAVFVNIHDGVVVLNLNWIVIDINPAACQLLALVESAAIGQTLAQLGRENPNVAQLWRTVQAHTAQADTTIEVTFRLPTTSVIEVMPAALRDRRHRLTGQILTLRDITQRRSIELELAAERQQLAQRVAVRTAELSRANAELATAARLKDEFLANMSHELRTPLNTILGLSEALQDEIYGPVAGPQHRAIQHVLDAGRHLLALINDILDVSKIEAGKFTIEPGPVAVDSLCQSSINFIKQNALKKEQTITINIDPIVQIVFADERRLKQILVNLLSNAVKFTPRGGQVGLDVYGEPLDNIVHFRVWDNGIGIAEADMAELFRPFVQLDSRLTRQHEGTGLGLALVQRMVELHGGSIAVESKANAGASFVVSLPWSERSLQGAGQKLEDNEPSIDGSDKRLVSTMANAKMLSTSKDSGALPAQPVSPAQSVIVDDPIHWQRATLLLVEDNEINIRTFQDYLQTMGYPLVVRRNGGEALAYLREGRPDLILLDIQMPGMNGWEVAHHIRKIPELRQVPIIALTALAMPGDRERCLAAGMDEYVSKPVSLRHLSTLINTHINARDNINAMAPLEENFKP